MPQTAKTKTAAPSIAAADIRRQFIDFFADKHDHTFVPSSPVVPHNDPTLLFTNAGMNQFKDVFLGTGSRDYVRAVNSQKCIRAGGKHNDLEDVGRDTYHHTFFEMLGNWSFGDYFKREAIQWAWQLLTDVWGLDKDRLYITVFEGDTDDGLDPDTEAEQLWQELTDIDPSHISRWGKKDNFWEMGDSGPCGPCSEIHYDNTPDKSGASLVNADHPDVIEIWNLVFIQFNRAAGKAGKPGKLSPLPAKHVDTGMGFERIVRVLQGKASNYDTDIWTPIFDAIREKTGAKGYSGALDDPVDTAYRVIADHVRCLTIALTDGAMPGSDGRGYVLRRILRRAVRVARQTLDVDKPMLCEIVPAVVDSLGEAFPELKKDPQRVADVIRAEEEAFLRTIDRGIEHFREAASGGSTVSAEDAFKLHDTFGFPIDLTCVMAEERGMTVDVDGFEKLMTEAREKSRAGGGGDGETAMTLPPQAIGAVRRFGLNLTDDDAKYARTICTGTVKAIWNGSDFDNVINATTGDEERILITDRTCFYAEAGGQVGDTGIIRDNDGDGSEFHVRDTQRAGPYVLHIGRLVKGKMRVGEGVELTVERSRRRMIAANHTGTHLLNHALRQVVGAEVDQRGSLVADDKLRFDFTCTRAMSDKEINGVERLVNAGIHQDLPVNTAHVPLEEAQAVNSVRAVFGEKYPDPVRVVSVGPTIDQLREEPDRPRWAEFSIEFCGGTHLERTGEAVKFIIASEGALAAGVRRIVALTGPAAKAADAAGKELETRAYRAKQLDGEEFLEEIAEVGRLAEQLTISAVSRHRVEARLEPLRDQAKAQRKKAQQSARKVAVEHARAVAEKVQGRIIVDRVNSADREVVLAAMDVIKAHRPEAAIMLFGVDEIEEKITIVAVSPKPVITDGLKAGDWVREAATVCGGGGGGRPDMAQAGGKDLSKVGDAMDAAKQFAEDALK